MMNMAYINKICLFMGNRMVQRIILFQDVIMAHKTVSPGPAKPSLTVLSRTLYDSRSRGNVMCSSQTTATQTSEDIEELSGNDKVQEDFINRNPRNLERMAVARKDKGWARSHPRKDYWHKLYLTKSNRHISAYIQHYNGHIVVRASTKEWAIKQHLFSTGDVAAATNVGRVLAQRCLESGISYVHVNMPYKVRNYERTSVFLSALKEGGVVLNEPKSITDFREPINYFPDVDQPVDKDTASD